MSYAIEIATEAGLARRHRRRERVERLLDRAVHLEESDRLLIEQVYRHGVGIVDVARLSGQSPKNLRRRVDKLLKHINGPLFSFMLAHSDLLSEATRRTADLVVLKGCSLRRASEISNQSLHQTRQHMQIVQALAEA